MIYTTDLFEAVMHHETVEVRCVCGNRALFHPNGLWWRFYRKGWPYRYAEMRPYFYCTYCLKITGNRVRPDHIDRTCKKPVIELPMPAEREWKQMIRQMRGS